ncbi:MAG: lipase family protein [bacterium]
MRQLALVFGLSMLLLGCGGDDDHKAAATPTPTPVIGEEETPFELDLALELGRLCLQSYQMLTDFQDDVPFTLPAPYALRMQYLTQERYPGETGSEAIPIAFIATSGDAIYVVFRGTKTISEWISDATFTQQPFAPVGGTAKTETGFTVIYDSINAAIIDEVEALAASGAYTTLYITGHSLGAALATLAVPDLARATRFDTPILYNFASPRTGNPDFAVAVDALPTSWRIANTNDEVPKLPPAVSVVFTNDTPHFLFYEHIDSEYPITFGTPIHSVDDVVEDHAMCNYYATLCDQSADPTSCKAMAEGADGCMPE